MGLGGAFALYTSALMPESLRSGTLANKQMNGELAYESEPFLTNNSLTNH